MAFAARKEQHFSFFVNLTIFFLLRRKLRHLQLTTVMRFTHKTIICQQKQKWLLVTKKAQLNFSGPWENINTLCQYLFLQRYKTLPHLTVPDQFSIPFPNPAGGTHSSPVRGHLSPAPKPDYFLKLD